MSAGARYYRPYVSSDSESDSDSDSSISSRTTSSKSSTESYNNTGPNFREFASNLQLTKAAGPGFSTMQEQLYYHQSPNARYYDIKKAFESIKPVYAKEGFANPLPVNPSGASQKAPAATDKVTSIILLNSRDRDRTVYPQPTFVQLRLPREYKNIIALQILQVSLLTSFYYFRPDKFNMDFTIYEQNRAVPDANGVLQQLNIKNLIREGSYSISTLLAEMMKWLNNVPVFFDFINGFSDFQALFSSTSDFGVNFNEPGDYFYDTLLNDFIANPTKDYIITRYWKNRYSSQTSYTIEELRMAYYFPVLKECVLDANYPNAINLSYGLNIDPTILTDLDVSDRIVYTFQGIDDPVVLSVVNGNQAVLDNYRLKHTFRYYLVNKYNLTINPNGQTVIFTSPSLNTSLINLLNGKNLQFYNQQFSLLNITSNQYNAISASNDKIRAILQDMNNYQQKQFAQYFAIPFNNYASIYYSHLDWTILTRNGIGAVGIPQSYSDSNFNPTTALQLSNNIIAILKQEPYHFWPNMSNLSDTLDIFKKQGEYNYPYIINAETVNLNSNIINHSTNYLVPSLKDKTVNSIVHISSSRYTVFQFASPVRQTLQIETLPRPTQYRIPAYNAVNYDSTIQKFFDSSYAFVESPYGGYAPYTYKLDNIPQSNITDISGWSSNTFPTWNLSYDSSFSTTYQQLLSINTPYKSLFFSFIAPDQSNYNSNISTFRYQFNIKTLTYDLSGNPVHPRQALRILFYKDRGGFMADVSANRQEYPYNAIASTILSTNTCNIDIALTTYPKQKFYMTIRPDQNSFGAINIKVVPYFASSFQIDTLYKGLDSINPSLDNPLTAQSLLNYNYAQIYDSNYICLPIMSTLWPPDPSIDASQTLVLSSNTPIGYDANSVSIDYTDYMPFIVGKSTNFTPYGVSVGIDPINKYQFESNSPYDVTAQNFIYPGSKNQVLLPQLIDLYSTATVAYRQETIVHYYSLNYIISGWDVGHYSPYLTSNIVQLPYSQYSIGGNLIRGYEYASETGNPHDSNLYLSLGVGPCGFSFIPGDGIWDVDRVVIRSAFTNSNNDPNSNIMYLGVYNTQDIYDLQTIDVCMRSSICILSNTDRVTYNPNDPLTLSAGFDLTGGSYYQFQKTLVYPTSNKNPTIIGYTQDQGTITNDIDNLYSIIAFDSNEKPTVIRALSGSIVPYPYYNTPFISTMYSDGTLPPETFFYDLVYPVSTSQSNFPLPGGDYSNYSPGPGYDGTQSFFSLSQPIGTSVLHYIQASPFVIDVSGIFAFDLQFPANNLVGNVKDFIMTQNTNFQVWSYQQDYRNLILAWNLNADLIFPPDEQTSILAITGNTTDFVFLGAKSNTSSNFQLRLKKFNPVSGLLYEFHTLSTFIISNDIQLNTFTYTNMDGFIFTGATSSNVSKLYRSLDRINLETFSYSNANIYHSQDCSSNNYYWLKQDSNYCGSTFYQVVEGTSFPGRPFKIQSGSITPLPSTFRTMAVSLFRGQPYETAIDEILFTTLQDTFEANFFSVYQLNSNTGYAIILKSISQFSNYDISGSDVIPARYVQPGYNSSRWFMTERYPYLWANRNNTVDNISRIQSAWQIYYPWQKIILKKIANNTNPIVDLTSLEYPEYPHTEMFYYNNLSSMTTDISKRWGLEQSTNFVVADTTFAGFYFNSYIFTCPLRASCNTNDLQYIALRNYSPTEESHVMVRFVLGNKYTFGYTTLKNIGEEATLYKSGVSNLYFDPNYGVVLSNFDNQFQVQKAWGCNLVPNYPGSNIGFSTYTEFSITYSNLYTKYNSNSAILSQIVSTVRGQVNNYIIVALSNILPTSALTRQQYTDPLQYKILWQTSLTSNYAQLTDNWGLGYNLGFAKQDTSFGTIQRAQSFYKIIDDYIYLRISPQYPLNKLDFGAAENLSVTRDSTGATQTYYGKLLLNNFNSLSQTLVQNAVTLVPAIGKLESLSFQWLEFSGAQVNNLNCDWNISVSITEEVIKSNPIVQTGV